MPIEDYPDVPVAMGSKRKYDQIEEPAPEDYEDGDEDGEDEDEEDENVLALYVPKRK